MVALELISESPSRSTRRQGCWLFCGSVFARVIGPSRGEGLIAGTCCGSLEQLQRLKGEAVVLGEMKELYEAVSGTVVKPGVLRIAQQAFAPHCAGALFYNNDDSQCGTISLPSKTSAEVVHKLPDG